MPAPRSLQAFYASYYDHSDERITFHQAERLARHILRQSFSKVGNEGIDILDFGGGDGSVSRSVAGLLLKSGASRVRIALVDYNSEVNPSDSEQVSLTRHESLDVVAGRAFHLSIASAILEHIPYPRAELMSLCRSLRPGGVLYVRTPSMVPIGRVCRALGIPFDFTFPAHVHDLGQTFWRRIWNYLPLEATRIDVLRSRPSLVETTFRLDPVRTLGAHLLKAPWHVLGHSYGFVGGWEIFIRKREVEGPLKEE
jgi:2-polyprenyl-3-methyl-5-hydroxy-6-metoxy-1,4-benzoquinol methylase